MTIVFQPDQENAQDVRFRARFRNGSGDPNTPYAEPAASRFANEPWTFAAPAR